MKNFPFLLLLLCFLACKFDSKEKPFTPNTVDASKEIANWTCTPGKQIGLIQKNATEAAIIKLYGQENVIRKEIGMGEGETTMATIIFPETKNEMVITWKTGQPFKVIENILVDKKDAPWTTASGIHIGTTLEELVKINGKEFQFAGFEWDNSGYTNEWMDGNISKNVIVYLEPNNPEVVYPDLLGDELFSSNLPTAKAADLKVRALVFSFE